MNNRCEQQRCTISREESLLYTKKILITLRCTYYVFLICLIISCVGRERKDIQNNLQNMLIIYILKH